MISVNQARKLLSENLTRSEKQILPLKKCLGLFLSENVFSPIDVPSFDNSAKDGYAIKFNNKNDFYKLQYTVQAGDSTTYQLSEGEAARIFTGAKMPKGADTVIPQEIVEKDDKNKKISFQTEKINIGSNVRYQGSQCKKGDLIAKTGTKITPGAIGLLASVGLAEVPVFCSPRICFIITGDELKEIGSALQEGEIYNSNGPMLEALLKNLGMEEILALKAADDKETLQQTINTALEATDVLLLSGGISVGDYDFV
ncbi:MAG TPA: molybdopterin molybdotransferase MoeA, partial [Flavobacteriaceae bacterium]|nr:molybdopterin molybdotransferase MoeA [Flavobacteriaceae bacterium]